MRELLSHIIHLKNRELLKESAASVAHRYFLAFGVGYLAKWMILDRLIGPDCSFDYA